MNQLGVVICDVEQILTGQANLDIEEMYIIEVPKFNANRSIEFLVSHLYRFS